MVVISQIQIRSRATAETSLHR